MHSTTHFRRGHPRYPDNDLYWDDLCESDGSREIETLTQQSSRCSEYPSLENQQPTSSATMTPTIIIDSTVHPIEYATTHSAAVDLRCTDSFTLDAGEFRPIPTGVFIKEMPDGYFGEIRGRSGLAVRHGIGILAGIIDSDYRGEIKAILHNNGREPFVAQAGDRIAQMVFCRHYGNETNLAVNQTVRGTGGFGSTGMQ